MIRIAGPSLSTKWRGTEGEDSEGRTLQRQRPPEPPEPSQDPLKSAPMSARIHISVSLLLLSLLTFAASARAANLPPGFVETQIASGLDQPTAIAMAPDGRIFVCEQRGRLRVIKNGALLPTPFLTVDGRSATASAGCSASRSTRTSRPTTTSTSTTPSASPTIAQPGQPLHRRRRHGASPAARRSCSTCDTLATPPTTTAAPSTSGPTASSTSRSARTRSARTPRRWRTRSGKILRINPDGSIPTDNPFYTRTTGTHRGDLGPGPAQPVHLRLPARHRADVHQRRRRARLGGDRRGRRRRQLRLAGRRGADDRPAVPRPALRLPARQRPRQGLRDHRRRLLRPGGGRRFPADYPGELLLRRLLQRLDPPARPGDRGDRPRSRPASARRST